jgi:hypothetical protein
MHNFAILKELETVKATVAADIRQGLVERTTTLVPKHSVNQRRSNRYGNGINPRRVDSHAFRIKLNLVFASHGSQR